VDINLQCARIHPSPDATTASESPYALSIEIVRLRRGKEVRLLIPGNDGGLQACPDPALIKLLANAFAARDAVNAAASGQTLNDVAKSQGYSLEYFSLLLRL
jgi:hypothetical protein